MRVSSTIKWFSNLKGFGFAEPVPGSDGEDVFVHVDNLRRDYPGQYLRVHKDDKIEFDLADRGRGPIADDVVVTEVGNS